MTASDHLHPDQFSKLTFTDFPGGTIDEVADHLYSHEPQFMGKLEQSVRRNGVREPIELAGGDRVYNGHHRIAAAYRANKPVPYTEPYPSRSPQAVANDTRWHEIRRGFPEEEDARWDHDEEEWRDQ